MASKLKQRVLFTGMAVLIFALSHFLLYSSMSTGPNEDVSFGWLVLHRYGKVWSVAHVNVGILGLTIFASVLITWMISRMFLQRLV